MAAPTSISQVDEAIRKNPMASSKGLYTAEIVDGADPESIARVLNELSARVNLDTDREVKRRAREFAFRLFFGGMAIGAVITYFAIMVAFHPLREPLSAIMQALKH